MNKQIEAAIVVIIGSFTTLSVGTYIHNVNSHPSGFDRKVGTFVQKAESWLSTHAEKPSSPPSAPRVPSLKPIPTSQTGAADTSALVDKRTAGISSADMQTAEGIGEEFIGSMTSADWEQVYQILTTETAVNATADLTKLLDKHLSPEDRNFLISHLGGSQPFDQVDVHLLQNVVSELTGQLTAGERQLLSNQLSQYGIELPNL